jgi:diguanylate cyclase (GGDEF)-like protein
MWQTSTDETGNRGSILVVDDSRLVRAMIARCLQQAGYGVREAENGAEALRMLATDNFDVVITDLRMPELDGFGVLSAVKRLAPLVEVIILTGTHAQDMNCAVRALRLGAHDYLTKPPARAEEVIMTVERAIEKKRLKEANLRLLRELEMQSRTDVLTGLPNRRAFEAAVAQETARARRHGHALGVVALDIDHFKQVNDSHGHQAGDRVLQAFAQTVSAALREGDVLYRFGGEEFVVILAHTDLGGAVKVAERLVSAVAATSIAIGAASVQVTTSAGAACLCDSDADGASLLSRADAALYAAKKNGRNQARATGTRLALVSGGRAS